MKNMKRFKAIALCVLMITSLFVFAACGEDEPEQTLSKEAEYQVTVVDALGNAYSGVVVRFMQGKTQVAMQVVDATGVAKKTLDRGDYTVELMFTGDAVDYHYEKDGLNLSAEKTTLDIILSNTVGTSQSLFANGEEFNAHHVSAGCTYVELTSGMNYFLFAPGQAGCYEFSMMNTEAAIGYYGTPHFVQVVNMADVKDNKFTQSVSASMIGTGNTGTTVMVLGVKAEAGQTSGILAIDRVGDPEWNVADEPWRIYQTTVDLEDYVLPEGAKLGEFDLLASTDKYTLVLNEDDGFYHLNSADGPLVLMRLGEKSKYLESFKKILETSGVVKYFYDADGKFEKKESYSECLVEYIEHIDEDAGVYPLTEDLKYILQQRGDYVGWWNPNSGIYLFVDESGVPMNGINHEIAWLFMCCYIEG